MRESFAQSVIADVSSWCEFGGDRAYLLLAIARRKSNEHVSSGDEVVFRRVLVDRESVEFAVRDMLSFVDRHDRHFRVYVTVNARSVESAFFGFCRELLGLAEELYNGHEGAETRISRLPSEWRSELHSPEHRVETMFQFDLDDVSSDEVQRFISELPNNDNGNPVRRFMKSTPNGFHVITDSFNYMDWDEPVPYDEMDTDGMLHIAEIDGRQFDG